MSSINNIPHEILSTWIDKCRSSTCKLWREIWYTKTKILTCKLKNNPKYNFYRIAPDSISKFVNITNLNLDQRIVIDNSIAVLTSLTKLQSLTYSNHYMSESILISLTNLTTLRCASLNVTSESLKHLTKLSTLVLTAYKNVDYNSVSKLVNLTRLSLIGDTSTIIKSIINLPHLNNLCLKNDETVDSDLKKLTNITKLYLNKCNKISVKGLGYLTNVVSLRMKNMFGRVIQIFPKLLKLVDLVFDSVDVMYNMSLCVHIQNLTILKNDCIRENITILTRLKKLYIGDHGAGYPCNRLCSLVNLTDLSIHNSCEELIWERNMVLLTNLTRLSLLDANHIKFKTMKYYMPKLIKIHRG
jgi:hypothetical protein